MNSIDWHGFKAIGFEFEGKWSIIVFPKTPEPGRRFVLKTEYWDAFPETEIELLGRGFHIAFVSNDNRWAGDADVDRKYRFVKFISEKYSLSQKCALEGMSCGGMYAVKFAYRYPEVVSCLYLDAPVINFMSCPAGFGKGIPLHEDWFNEISKALNFSTVSDLLNYRGSPIYIIDEFAKRHIPAVFVAGDSDRFVPFNENGELLADLYKENGTPCEVYIKKGADHHPHGLEDPTPVVDFICRYA